MSELTEQEVEVLESRLRTAQQSLLEAQLQIRDLELKVDTIVVAFIDVMKDPVTPQQIHRLRLLADNLQQERNRRNDARRTQANS